MAMGKKTTMEVELHQDTVEMLEYAKETYGFRSTSKALRVILDYMVACLLYTSPSPRDRG